MKKGWKIALGALIVLAAPVALALFLVVAIACSFLSLPLAALPMAVFSAPFLPLSPQESIGDYRCTAHCEYAVFQDGASYAEYVYETPSFEENPYFRPVTVEDREMLLIFVDDFEGWVDALEDSTDEDGQALYQSYRYDAAMLSEDDWFYLETKDPENPFMNYDLYLYDAERQTLFYMESVL